MRRASRIHAGVLAGLLLSGGTALAQAASPPAAQPRPEGDRAFLERALGVNELEVRLGHLAAERGATPEVKAAGRNMIEKHTALGQELGALARQAGASGTAELSPDQRAAFDRVAAQPASGFDAEFRRTVDAGHVQELAMYRDELSRASSPALRALAERRVAALEKALAGSAQGAKAMPQAAGTRGDR
jgi:putative membrane protein